MCETDVVHLYYKTSPLLVYVGIVLNPRVHFIKTLPYEKAQKKTKNALLETTLPAHINVYFSFPHFFIFDGLPNDQQLTASM